MTLLTVPQGGTDPGRAARVREVPSGLGQAVEQVGNAMMQAADRIKQDRHRSQQAQAQISMTSQLNDLRLELEQSGDPDFIDAEYARRAGEIRETVVAGVDEQIRENVGFAFDDLSNRHGYQLGRASIGLRQSRGRAELDRYATTLQQAAPGAGVDAKAGMLAQYEAQLAQAQALGIITPEDAEARLQGVRSTTDEIEARRLLAENPAGLAVALEDNARFANIPGTTREVLRRSALSAVASIESKAAAEAERQAGERQAQVGEDLRNMVSIARAGRVSGDEHLLEDPEYQDHPGYAEAAAAVKLRNALPEFASLPVGQMDDLIRQEEARKVTEKFEPRILDAMRSARDGAAEAWADDPIAKAADMFGDIEGAALPPELPEFDASDPTAFGQALAARRRYAQSLEVAGYVPRSVYFTKAERQSLAELAAIDAAPADRAALAGTLVSVFGPQAGAVFRELEVDPVFAHMGGMMVAGGDPRVIQEAFAGQQALAEKTVELPTTARRRETSFDTLNTIFAPRQTQDGRIVPSEKSASAVRAAAAAIYAARARGIEPDSEDAAELYEQALQQAMGARLGSNGSVISGGIQTVQGVPTILPPMATAAAAERALDLAATVNSEFLRSPERGAMRRGEPMPKVPNPLFGQPVWQTASRTGGEPQFRGQAITADQMARIELRAVGSDHYEIVLPIQGTNYIAADSETGTAFRFSLEALIAETGAYLE